MLGAKGNEAKGCVVGAVKGFLANYSGNLQAALVLWPVFSAMLTLPILAYLYHRDGRLRFGSVVATYLAVLYVLGIGCFTLWPLPDGDAGPGITYGVPANFNPLNFIGDIQKDGLRAVFQLLFNVVFFVPLGFIAGRLLRMRFWPTVLVALGTSVLVETAQYTGLFGLYDFAYRCCDVDDVITNTLGGAVGWMLAAAFTMVMPQKMEAVDITEHPGFLRRCVALWIDLTIIQLGTLLVWLVISGGWQLATGALPQLSGLDSQQTNELAAGVIAAVLFLVVEVVVPWRHDGSTPGGSFVRMTCESHPRTTGYRIAFYVARTLTLAAALYVPFVAVPFLLVFYLIARRMPYDYVP